MKRDKMTITSIGSPDVQTAITLAVPLLLKFINETKRPTLRAVPELSIVKSKGTHLWAPPSTSRESDSID